MSTALRQNDAAVQVPTHALLVHTIPEIITLAGSCLSNCRTQLVVTELRLPCRLREPCRFEDPLSARRTCHAPSVALSATAGET